MSLSAIENINKELKRIQKIERDLLNQRKIEEKRLLEYMKAYGKTQMGIYTIEKLERSTTKRKKKTKEELRSEYLEVLATYGVESDNPDKLTAELSEIKKMT